MQRAFANKFTVQIVPVLKDNYSYAVQCGATKKVALVDVATATPALEAARSLLAGAELTKENVAVFTTHKHGDHCGGNREVSTKVPGAAFYAGEHEPVPCKTVSLADGETVPFGSLHVTAHHTPCHTTGHVLLHFHHPEHPNDGCVFTGDTVFVGGLGAFFEGNASQMCTAMKKFAALPDQTAVYCGHEYTMGFMDFAKTIAPEDTGIRGFSERCQKLRDEGLPTIPSIVADEKTANVFLRATIDPAWREARGLGETEVAAMEKLYNACP